MDPELVTANISASGARPERRDRSDKVAEKVARRILRDIVARALKPGSKLPPEAMMLQRYEIGRASLREGLRILEVYGLIWIKPGPGGGPVVADVSSIDFGRSATFFFHAVGATLHDLVEARVHLEPLMARLASERLTEETAAALQTALDFEQDTLNVLVPPGERPFNATRFHSVLDGMSGNRVLSLFGVSIMDIYIERIRPVYPVYTVDRRRDLHETHAEIGTAILKGHATKAERLMRVHVEDMARIFAKNFSGLADEIIDWR